MSESHAEGVGVLE